MSLEMFMPDAVTLAELNRVPTAASDFLGQVSRSKAVHTANPSFAAPARVSKSVSADNLTSLGSACDHTVASADAALKLLDELDRRHKEIADRTSVLHAECKTLVEDESYMRTMAQRVYTPLTYFESAYIIGRRLGVKFPDEQADEAVALWAEMQRAGLGPVDHHSATPFQHGSASSGRQKQASNNPHRVRILDLPLTPEDDDFALALDRIEECMGWLANHLQYRDARAHMDMFKAMQDKAIALVLSKLRTAVEKVAASAAADIRAAQAAVAAALSLQPADTRAVAAAQAQADAVEISALQLRWRTELSSLRPLLSLIESRAGSKRVYLEASRSCYELYLQARLLSVNPTLRAKLDRVVQEKTRPMREGPGKGKTPVKRPLSASSVSRSSESEDASTAEGASSVASVHSAYTAGTGGTAGTWGTRGTMLYSEAVTLREACVVDAVRTCAALLARAVSGEYALFHALFTRGGGKEANARAGHHSTGDHQQAYGGDDAGSVSGRSAYGQRVPSSSASVVSERTAHTRGTRHTGHTGVTAGGLTVGGLPATLRTAADVALATMCEDLCSVLTFSLRPAIVALNSLDSLVDVVSVIRDEVIRELSIPRGPSLAPLAKAAEALLADVRERLAFRASGFISEYIDKKAGRREDAVYPLLLSLPASAPEGQVSVPVTAIVVQGDLDYPARLLAYYLRQRSAVEAANLTRAIMTMASSAPPTVAAEGGAAPAQLPAASPGFAPPAATQQAALPPLPDPELTVAPPLYDSWLPVVEDTLLLIAKLHASLDKQAFEALAREAVHACARVILEAGAAVKAAAAKHAGASADSYILSRLRGKGGQPLAVTTGTLPPAACLDRGLAAACIRLQDPTDPAQAAQAPATTAHLDGCLLVVRSLLTLREQLTPYDMDPILTETSMDFGPTGRALSDVLHGITDRSIFSLSRSNPLLGLFSTGLPSITEHKVDVRASLETALRASAEEATVISCTLLTRHLAAFTTAWHSHGSGQVASTITDPSSFISAADSALGKTRACFTALLPALRRRFGLYCGSPTTAAVLWRPVRERVAHVIIAARAVVGEALARGEQPTQDGPGSSPEEASGQGQPGHAAARVRLDGELAALLSALEATSAGGVTLDASSEAFGLD